MGVSGSKLICEMTVLDSRRTSIFYSFRGMEVFAIQIGERRTMRTSLDHSCSINDDAGRVGESVCARMEKLDQSCITASKSGI